jgi:putative oxidoreductase
MMTGIEIAVRCLLVALFLPFSALDKVLNFQPALAQASHAIANRLVARVLLLGGLCIEVVMSLAILSGIADRFAALVLAGYCVTTAVLWKRFWRSPDFRLRGASRGRETFWDFLKNLALAGGFLMLALGSDVDGIRAFEQHPFASSHPYQAPRVGAVESAP